MNQVLRVACGAAATLTEDSLWSGTFILFLPGCTVNMKAHGAAVCTDDLSFHRALLIHFECFIIMSCE